MLSLYVRKRVEIEGSDGKTRSFTVFADTVESDKFYIIPESPNFALDLDTSQPKFNFIWYYSSNYENGGICTFTVALPIPTEASEINQVAAQLQEDNLVIGRSHDLYKMVVAMNENETTTSKALREALGLTEAEAKAYQDKFQPDQDWQQFLPPSTINLLPLPIKGGKVSIRGFDNPNAYDDWQNGDQSAADFTGVYETTPSLLGDNRAVVSFNLNEFGANLFWHALGGPDFSGDPPPGYEPINSIIAVTYEVDFEAMLPPAKVIVTLESETVAKLITEEHTDSDTWGNESERTEVIAREYEKKGLSSIEVKIPSVSYLGDNDDTSAHEANYLELLTQWGSEQLAEMVNNQLPDFNWDDLKDGLKEEVVLYDETRVFQISIPVAFSVYPQDQLPTIGSIIGDEPLEQYFQAINLDNRPYYDVTVTINPPANIEDLSIGTLAVSPTFAGKPLYQDGQQVNTLVFDSNNKDQVELTGTFDVNSSAEKQFEYSCQVNYTNATPAYQFSGTQTENYNLSLVSGATLGVVYAELVGGQILWDIFNRGELKVKYASVEQQYFLNQDDYDVDVLLTLGEQVTPTIEYQLKLDFATGGNSLTYPLDSTLWASMDISQGTGTIQVPYENTKQYIFLCPAIGSGKATMCIVQATYTLMFPGGVVREISTNITLNAANNGLSFWTVPTSSLENFSPKGTVSYTATIVTSSGTEIRTGDDDNGTNLLLQIDL
ncbi:hypothetical protein [Coleofasciculus sp. F4-SAH-05]|uniref:hypothetical protein n=1 Tax=Coleofasciculus sp. F4-SAH-05 TaxID=3069525 RepID=UPI0032F9BFDE